MMIGAVDQDHLRRGTFECFGRRQSAKATTDDHDNRGIRVHTCQETRKPPSV
jgi:hypothetical protein